MDTMLNLVQAEKYVLPILWEGKTADFSKSVRIVVK